MTFSTIVPSLSRPLSADLPYEHSEPRSADKQIVHGNQKVLKKIREHFHEYATRRDDRYVNISELKEAAGQIPTSRTFSKEASEYAKALLGRPELLRQLDIGIDATGFPGKEDGRFDLQNLNYLIPRTKGQVSFDPNGFD